jgi:DNA ligase-1
VRAFWNGEIMLSKNGKKIECPHWFVEFLPKHISLDCELWLGRGSSFELLHGGILQSKDDFGWSSVSLMVFDVPSSTNSYELRIRDLGLLNLPSHVHALDIERCRGKNHLQENLIRILEHGGEGLMAIKPNSSYVAARTNSLVKVKVWQLFCLTKLSSVIQ